jgi:hypothetical protein
MMTFGICKVNLNERSPSIVPVDNAVSVYVF